MPVIGHAFVGAATALATRPGPRARWAAALWLPVLIGLAYLPDVTAHLLRLLAPGDWAVLTHSAVFLLATGLLCAPLLAWWGHLPAGRALLIALFSIGAHVVLDLAQSTDRRPWWPLSEELLVLKVLPTGVWAELVIFGGAFAAFWVLTRQRRRKAAAASVARAGPPPDPLARRRAWLGGGLTVLLALAVLGTHALRGWREDQLRRVPRLLAERQYAAALSLLESARRWPYTARPGQPEYLQAEAYAGLGQVDQAAALYSRAHALDPADFWFTADGALFEAGRETSVGRRQAAMSPYLRTLRARFGSHPRLPWLVEKLRRRLGLPPASDPQAGLEELLRLNAGGD